MYRFRETERFEGKSILTNGVTSRSLKALKHLPKVGRLLYISGGVYASKRAYDSQPITRIFVRVVGEQGSIRFGGFLWGYGGEGPRGLMELFKQLGIKGVDVPTLCGGSPSYRLCDCGEWWRLTFTDGDPDLYKLEVKRSISVHFGVERRKAA